MSVLEVRDLAVDVAGLPIVRELNLSLRPGDKVGVVGRNGAGKTSLLRVIVGEVPAVAGRVTVRGRLGYLRQDPRQHRAEAEHSGLAHVLQARGLQEMAERLEKFRLAVEERPTDANVRRFARLEERFRTAGGYSGEAEAGRIAAGLGLPQDRLGLPVPALSGGERRRLELARILFAGSDVLLLDEPTNHLDADAKRWLMRYLAASKGAVVVVSHDLALLDAAITRILHLDRDGVVQYRGTYSEYRAARRQDEIRRARLAERQRRRSGGSRPWPTRCAARPPSGPARRRRSIRGPNGSRRSRCTRPGASGRCDIASPTRRAAARSSSWPRACRRATAARRSSRT
jgi:ATPase subunit of ABC transporter with duplicated ATPase domains